MVAFELVEADLNVTVNLPMRVLVYHCTVACVLSLYAVGGYRLSVRFFSGV